MVAFSDLGAMASFHFIITFVNIVRVLRCLRAITAQKMKFSVNGLFCKCDQIRSFLRIWSHLLEKSLMKTSFFVQCITEKIQGCSLDLYGFVNQLDICLFAITYVFSSLIKKSRKTRGNKQANKK